MKIIHLCGGRLDSGATLGVIPLHLALLDAGIHSKIIFSKGGITNEIPHAEPFFKSQIQRWLFEKSTKWNEQKIIKKAGLKKTKDFSIGKVGYPFSFKQAMIESADLIHLHWINSRFVNIKALKEFNKPIVWTLRDAWPYTGGCHYTHNCNRYTMSCGQCPQLNSSNPDDLSSQVLQSKKEHYPANIHYVGLSRWTVEEAKKSQLLKNSQITLIPNAIDSLFFERTCQTKVELRNQLGLPQSSVLILAGAVKLASRFKGYDEVLPKITNTTKADIHLVTFGRISDAMRQAIKVPSTHLGTIHSSDQMRKLYEASDLFIAPSKQEAFGKTLAEAGACGLPVICYDSGGPRDIVIDQETGLRVEPFNSNAFVEAALKIATQNDTRERYGRAAMVHIQNNFSPKAAAKKYINLYMQTI